MMLAQGFEQKCSSSLNSGPWLYREISCTLSLILVSLNLGHVFQSASDGFNE